MIDTITGDLACKAGDFVLGDATLQHQGDLLESGEGEYKQSATVGVGLRNFINEEDPTDMLRKIRMQFIRDGLSISELRSGTQLKIRAKYA